MTTVARTDQGKDTVLFKLLTLGPEPFSQLVRCTGWDAVAHRLIRTIFALNKSMKLTNKLIPNTIADAHYQAALLEMEMRHLDEYEDVHNGSGRSEELPSDLAIRQAEELSFLKKNRDELSIMQWIQIYGRAFRFQEILGADRTPNAHFGT